MLDPLSGSAPTSDPSDADPPGGDSAMVVPFLPFGVAFSSRSSSERMKPLAVYPEALFASSFALRSAGSWILSLTIFTLITSLLCILYIICIYDVKRCCSTPIPSARVHRVMAKARERDAGAGVWNFREVPRDVIVKAKIEAALQGKSVKSLLIELVETHWQELEKKGMLPKGK